MKEGMNTPRTIPSSWISAQPASDDVDAVRPGDNKKWTVPKDSKPELTVQLVPTGDEGVPLGRVQAEGNMAGVIVYVKPSEGEDFKPVLADNGKPKVMTLLLCKQFSHASVLYCTVHVLSLMFSLGRKPQGEGDNAYLG
jgi:hypothetical protein